MCGFGVVCRRVVGHLDGQDPAIASRDGRSGVPLATSSLTGGVVRKICWSNPTRMPPIVPPIDPGLFLAIRADHGGWGSASREHSAWSRTARDTRRTG